MAKMIGQKWPEATTRKPFGMSGTFCRLIVLGLAGLVLTGCLAKRSSYDVPVVPIAFQYKNAQPAIEPKSDVKSEKDSRELYAGTESAGFEDWWRSFGSDELNGLVNRGLANNPDMRIATVRLAQAKVRADQSKAGLSPSLSMPGLAARQAPGGTTVGAVPVTDKLNGPQNAIQGSLRTEFRLDLWGEQSALAESANLQLWRAVYERDNVQRNVAASIVSSYVEVVSLNDRLRVAQETERVLAATLGTMQRRLDLGDATIGDYEQQRALVFGLRAAIPGIEQQREDALNSLAFLVGSVPGALTLSDNGLETLSVPSVMPGLPSSLLLRRPDVRMAEARMLSADADIDVARARILPPVDLSAQAGYSSNLLAQFFQPKFFFWNTIANVTASIFDGGRREGEKKYSEAMHEEMVETYVRTIYQAMREVESALATIRLAGKRLDAQREAADAARRAWEVNTKVYAMGGADHLTLLESERTFHRYLDEFQRAQMENYRGYTALFLALGGGVKVGRSLPGDGRRPGGQVSGRITSGNATVNSQNKAFSVDGVDLAPGGGISFFGDGPAYWQIELPGLFHRTTVSAAWRDLRGRYPQDMSGRMVRPRLNGRIEDSEEGQESWYRLFIAKFDTPDQAHQFCGKMLANQERCRVVTAKGDEVLPPVPPLEQVSKDVVLTPHVQESKPIETKFPLLSDTEPSSSRDVVMVAAAVNAKEGVAYTIQLGAFSNLENAAISNSVWEFRGHEVYVSELKIAAGKTWYAVRTGIFLNKRDAIAAAMEIRRKDEASAVVVPTVVDAKGLPQKIDISDVLTSNVLPEVAVSPEPPEARMILPEESTSTLQVPATVSQKSRFAVQLAAFSSPENAEVSRKYWQAKGLNVYVALIRDDQARPWYAIRTGDFSLRRDASTLALQLGRKESISAMVVSATVASSGKLESADLPLPIAATEIAENRKDVVPSPVVPSLIPRKSGDPIRYTIQLGVFASIENAAKLYSEWQLLGYEPYVSDSGEVDGKPRFSVRTGDYLKKREAQSMSRIIERQDGRRSIVVPVILLENGQLSRIDVTPLLDNPASVPSADISGNNVR